MTEPFIMINHHDYGTQILTDEELPVGNKEKLDDCSDLMQNW